jgi:hypothetical protein
LAVEVSEEWVTGRCYLDMLLLLLVELGLLALALDFGRGQLLAYLHHLVTSFGFV